MLTAENAVAPAGAEGVVPSPLRSVHSTSLAALLEQLGTALLVTTYQAGKLVVARQRDGVVNTHFRDLPAPMGLALAGGRLTVGTTFTRGLEFAGRYAFVGLSQVRETAVFIGSPITERLAESERSCGVWVVDIETGQVVALLRFEEGVQEVFAVLATPGRRYPDLIQDDAERINNSFVLPGEALAQVPDSLRTPGPSQVVQASGRLANALPQRRFPTSCCSAESGRSSPITTTRP